ncbi:hypothetical protein SAMN04487972_12715 [Paracoccus halophilus]|uniref:DUF1109 domain-containing protein n=1 Tax=Paracoccus halophilus TaxID=376733 RepID=A0A099EWQ0_9RHOB|nr:DUF1109 domain-containing protein [Paracoccus halophilus]KGJ02850.1 hypothetical protein IT41_16250 [Paracoccus halophilus]SFA60192.1 hypothetical protein SAMN04487972_12715 [Paracoccus halophilus]
MTSTDELIARLAEDPPPPAFSPRRIAALAMASIALPAAAFLLAAGMRPALLSAWVNPLVPLKTALPLAICVLSLLTLLRLARPGARPGIAGWLLLTPVAAATVLWLGAFALLPPAERFAEVGIASVGECLGAIILLSIIPTVCILRLLREGAAMNPPLSGALVGMTAAAGAATGYSLFCTQDNPLFFVSWYGLALLVVTGAGAAFGGRVLRW